MKFCFSLHYMEHSSVENASTENLKKLHRMVTAVKRDGEVGLAYMKSFEREARIRREGQTQEIIRGRRRRRNSRKNEGSYKAWTQIRKVREGNYFIAAGGTAYR